MARTKQCPATEGDARCLFQEGHDGDHAFTEESADAIIKAAEDAPGDAPEAETATGTAPDASGAGEAKTSAPRGRKPKALPAARVSENAWWCAACDAASQHKVTVCPNCGTPRA